MRLRYDVEGVERSAYMVFNEGSQVAEGPAGGLLVRKRMPDLIKGEAMYESETRNDMSE